MPDVAIICKERLREMCVRVSEGTRTPDILIHSQVIGSENPPENQQFSADSNAVYRPVYRENSAAPKNIVDLDALPPHIRAAVQALLDAAGPKVEDRDHNAPFRVVG